MKLRAFRTMASMTQQQLSELLRVSELSVINYENGKNIPSREQMLKIYQLSSGAVTPNDFYDLDSVAIDYRGFDGINEKESLLSIGLMSDTRLERIEASLLLTDGVGYLKEIGSTTLQFDSKFQEILNRARQTIVETKGDLQAATSELPELPQVIQRSTELHAELVHKLIQQLGYKSRSIDLIGYHGQTLYHAPQHGKTIQIGDAQRLSDLTGIATISDFRSTDIRSGGQGAPLAPLFHRALALQSNLSPATILHLGGIASLTLINEREEDLYAFDSGPACDLVDRFINQRIGKSTDPDGGFALAGKVHPSVLSELCQSAIVLEDRSDYLSKPPPKSLDASSLQLVKGLDSLNLNDGCATLTAFTAQAIAQSLKILEDMNIKIPKLWIAAGAGSRNQAIMSELRQRVLPFLGNDARLETAERVSWNSQSLQAQIFAYLAVRSLKRLNLSLPGTTGVRQPVTGGRLSTPSRGNSQLSNKFKQFQRQPELS